MLARRGLLAVIGLGTVAESERRSGNQDGVAIVALCPALGVDHFGGPAHATIVFCGQVNDVSLQQALQMDSTVRVMALLQAYQFSVPVVGEAMFGENNDERVILLPEEGTPFTTMRMRTAYLSKSRFTRYRPHVATMESPSRVTFTGLALWYGTKQILHPFLFPQQEVLHEPGNDRDDEGGGGGAPPPLRGGAPD